MLLIKLDAINSTNDFLKELAADQRVENYTTVTAQRQLKGKGQRGSIWESEPGNNLIMSVFVADSVFDLSALFLLNASVALAVAETLNTVVDVSIKWPNDIMADKKKLGGILIENSFSGTTLRSVIGIGINVNQTEFPALPHATSLKILTGKNWDIDPLIQSIVENLKIRIANLNERSAQIMIQYNEMLYRRGCKTVFNSGSDAFSATIVGVGTDGLLQLRHDDGKILKCDLNQVRMNYEQGNSM